MPLAWFVGMVYLGMHDATLLAASWCGIWVMAVITWEGGKEMLCLLVEAQRAPGATVWMVDAFLLAELRRAELQQQQEGLSVRSDRASILNLKPV